MMYLCPSFLSYLIVSLLVDSLLFFLLQRFFLFDSYDSSSSVAGLIPYKKNINTDYLNLISKNNKVDNEKNNNIILDSIK